MMIFHYFPVKISVRQQFHLFFNKYRKFMLLFFTFCKNKSAHVAYQLTWTIFYWNLHAISIPWRQLYLTEDLWFYEKILFFILQR